jgi:hypothetical protein
VPEYMSIELLDSEPGQYKIAIEVSDLVSEQQVTRERLFELVAVDLE